jgi:hypothetical protein
MKIRLIPERSFSALRLGKYSSSVYNGAMRRFWYALPVILFVALLGALLWHYVIVPKTTVVEYRNSQYGFTVVLPQDWRGYTIVTDTWQGMDVNDDGDASSATVTGPEILIRNPQWTEAQPYQDIHAG